MTNLTKHFTLAELDQRGAAKPEHIENLKRVAEALEVIRERVGVPLIINSGYRSPQHNKAVGGSKTSDHMKGLAADFRAKTYTPYELAMAAMHALLFGKIQHDQIIYYPNHGFVHLGLGARARGQFFVSD